MSKLSLFGKQNLNIPNEEKDDISMSNSMSSHSINSEEKLDSIGDLEQFENSDSKT